MDEIICTDLAAIGEGPAAFLSATTVVKPSAAQVMLDEGELETIS